MIQRSFENVHERLLRAGVSPRRVSRYVAELREHLTDLVARERAAGLDEQEAEAKARIILGTDAQLVQAMLDRGVPRSLAAKAPWAVFGVFPVVALVVVVMLLLNWSRGFFLPYRALSGAANGASGCRSDSDGRDRDLARDRGRRRNSRSVRRSLDHVHHRRGRRRECERHSRLHPRIQRSPGLVQW